MKIKYGKKIDSFELKKDLNKKNSIKHLKNTTLLIAPGKKITCCKICNHTENKFISNIYGFSYHECLNCSIAYVIDPPSDNKIKNIYNSNAYSEATRELLANDNIIDYRVNNIAKPKVDYILKNITTENKKWLDIGCGVGEIIHVVSGKGWDALGIETNDMERNYAIKKFGVKIINEYINEENITKYINNFGVISLFGILEHMKDPCKIMKQISRIQKNNDNIIIEVPHYPSFSVFSQITFPEYVNRMMLPPFHLFLFSLKSLEILLKNNNYEITHAWYFGQDIYEILSTLGIFIKDLSNSILINKLSLLCNDMQKVIDRNRYSDEVLIIGRKND